jgi:hypothetical protein
MRSVLLWLVVFFGTVFVAATPASAAPCQPAELFVTDNTDPLFEAQAEPAMSAHANFISAPTSPHRTPPAKRCEVSSTKNRCCPSVICRRARQG